MVSAWPLLSFGESIILLHARKGVLHVQVLVTPQGAGSLLSFPGHRSCVTAFLLLGEEFTRHDPRKGRGEDREKRHMDSPSLCFSVFPWGSGCASFLHSCSTFQEWVWDRPGTWGPSLQRCNVKPGHTSPQTCMRAKWLQSCPALCNSMDCSPPGSSGHGISQARKNTGVDCNYLLQWIFPTQGSNLHWRSPPQVIKCPHPLSNKDFQQLSLKIKHPPNIGYLYSSYRISSILLFLPMKNDTQKKKISFFILNFSQTVPFFLNSWRKMSVWISNHF